MDADKLNEAPVPNRILVDNLCTAARRHADPAIAIDDLREMRQWVIAHRSTCHGVASRLAEYDTAEIMINNTIGILDF